MQLSRRDDERRGDLQRNPAQQPGNDPATAGRGDDASAEAGIGLGDTARLAEFDNLFTQPNVQVVPITTAVFDRATHVRATTVFKLADSLHLAAAVEAGCDRFLTNDTRLSGFTDIPVEVLP